MDVHSELSLERGPGDVERSLLAAVNHVYGTPQLCVLRAPAEGSPVLREQREGAADPACEATRTS